MEERMHRSVSLKPGRLRRRIACALAGGIVIAGWMHAADPAHRSRETTPIVLEAVEIGAVRASTGGLLLSGQAGGAVDGALTWSLAGRDEDGRIDVPFVIEAEGGALLAGHGGRRIAIGIYAYVVDGEGRVVDHIAQGLMLEAATYRDPIRTSGLKFVGRFTLEPGDYTLRVMVQSNGTGNYFMSWSILALPFADDPSPQLLPPLFPDPFTQWVVARQHGGEVAFEGLMGAESFPAARPTLVESQPAELFLGGGGWEESTAVQIRILNDIGRVVSEPIARLTEPARGDFQFRRIVLSPVDLPEGEYTMKVTLADENGGEMLRRTTRLVVAGEGGRPEWPGVGDTATAAASTIGSTGTETTEKFKTREIRAAYRLALGPLGDGDALTSRRRVAELERRVSANGSRSALKSLGAAELAEAKALAKADPTCLMPLALLHRDLSRSYAVRRQGQLSSHAREMAITYAEMLAKKQPNAGFSEGLMVNFAADLAQAGASSAARDLLEHALRINPGYLPALLSLGFSFERNADYLEAADVYKKLVETHPDFDEGRLRLGMNLIRTGREEAGDVLLQPLVERGARPWIQAVAAQELVRQKAEKRNNLPEAEGEARAALERMPEDQRLWILLAVILERLNRHEEAVAVLSDLPQASRGISPRARYGEWPALGLNASQAFLTGRAEEAIPDLKSALIARGGAR